MKEEQVRALFLLAGIEVKGIHRVLNEYDPYLTPNLPWWLVETPFGMIKLGWRKRVIAIDWTRSAVRAVVTTDDVTTYDTGVHAYGYAKAVEYLTAFSHFAQAAQLATRT